MIRSGRRDQALAALDDGTHLLREVQISVDDIAREEELLYGDRMIALRKSMTRQFWTVVGGSAALLISTLPLAVVFFQGIVRRLGVLRDNARQFSAGKVLNPLLRGEDEIAEVDRAFHEMADDVVRQREENEMFVHSVSHDLRSPLVNLEGFSEELSLSCRELLVLFHRADVPEVVQQRGLELVQGDIEESVLYIQSAVGRLSRIIDALLRLSRAGRVEYQWQSIDVGSMVRKVVRALHDTVSAKNAEVVVGELAPGWGDPVAFEQIFGNLITNAVLYLDPARQGRIEIGNSSGVVPSQGVDLHVYYVKDNGLGIPAAYHDRVLTAFNRFHPDVAQGEGIGLALVRRAVERHGGRIWLESTEGTGTTFFVALPAGAGTGGAGSTGDSPAGVVQRGDE
jgi:signal transduction histidine kinase